MDSPLPLKERYEGNAATAASAQDEDSAQHPHHGYPKNQAAAKDKWKEENVSYNKWMEKIHNKEKYEYQGELSTICKPIRF